MVGNKRPWPRQDTIGRQVVLALAAFSLASCALGLPWPSDRGLADNEIERPFRLAKEGRSPYPEIQQNLESKFVELGNSQAFAEYLEELGAICQIEDESYACKYPFILEYQREYLLLG